MFPILSSIELQNIHIVCITHKMYSLIPFRSYSYVDITLIFWVGFWMSKYLCSMYHSLCKYYIDFLSWLSLSFFVCWNDLSSLGCIYMYWLYSPILFFSQLYLCVSLSSTVSSCISLSLAVFPSVYCILQFLFFPRLYLCVRLS